MIIGVIDNMAIRYATGWEQAIFHRVLIGLIGFLLFVFTTRVTWRKDCTILTGLIWMIAGIVLIVFSFIPQKVIEFVISTEYLTRIRFIMGLVSVLVLYITVESIRRTHLQEKYALLWVATALIILISVLFPNAVSLFRAVTGMEYATAIATVSFTFLVMVAFHFSISLSAIQTKHSKVAQRVAILEARVKKLEEIINDKGNAGKKITENSQRQN
jgi:hypothetical protein